MDLFDQLVGRHLEAGRGQRLAYVDSDLGEVTYDELARAVRRYAAAVQAMMPQPGARAMVVADDSVATVVAVLGMWASRVVPVPVSPLLTGAELEFIAGDCMASMAHLDGPAARQTDLEKLFSIPRFTGDWTRGLVRDQAARDEADALDWRTGGEVLVQYTSGSTGVPKGVLHGLTGISAVLGGFARSLRLRESDVLLSTAKLSFGYGFGNSLLFPLAAGAATVLMRGPVDVHRLSATLADTRPTVLFSVPRMYLTLLEHTTDESVLDSLRLAVSAGEHLPADLHARFEDRYGVPLVNGLGATEVLHIVLATSPDEGALGSTGWAVPGVVATVRDPDGVEVADGGNGRLHIAGPTVALGYLARPDETARTFANGGAFTGDIVHHGGAGDIRYVCRADDLLNLNGYKVSPLEIEAVARRTPGVSDCAVVGRVDEAGLQQVGTYVVALPGADRDEVRRAVLRAFRTQLASFKRPAHVEILDALPTTSTGKLARFKLRTGPTPPPTAGTTVINPEGAPALVCMPFAGGTGQAFSRLTKCLAPTWKVITGELPVGAVTSIGDAADAWWAAIREHVTPGAVIFGHSVGAAVVAELGRRYAARLTGVHLVASAPPVRPPDGLLRAALDGDEERLLDSLGDSGLLPDGGLSREELSRLVVPRVSADLRILRSDWYADPPAVAVHVLIGSDDPICTAEDVKRLLGGWNLGSVHVVEGGHYFCVDNPERTAEVLEAIALATAEIW
jgi:acyl-coenzyme A synthetase/AMP-(fatty) acid ligase/surfactin synthase thioesterase subunit